MDQEELQLLYARCNTPMAGRQLVSGALERCAERLPHEGVGCVGYYPNGKMVGTIAVPGRNLGIPLTILFEADPNVLAYVFQPFEVKVQIHAKDGRDAGFIKHTPTVLLIQRDGLVVRHYEEEWRLKKKADESPNYFKDDKSHTWHCKPAVIFFHARGIRHETHSLVELQLQHILTQNIEDISRYEDEPPLEESVRKALRSTIDAHVVLTIDELRDDFGFSADVIRTAIAQGLFHCDLLRQRLDGPFLVYRDAATLRAIGDDVATQDRLPFLMPENVWIDSMFQFNGNSYRVMNVAGGRVKAHGDGDIVIELPVEVVAQACRAPGVLAANGAVREQIKTAYAPLTEEEEEDGLKKLEALRDGKVIASERQMRRWKALVRTVETDSEAVALLAGRKRDRGNRHPRLEECEPLALRIIRRVFHLAPGVTILGTYRFYREYCIKRGLDYFSRTSFYKRAHAYRNLVKKYGARAASAMLPIPLILNSGRLPNGWLPHQIVHIDHTPADAEVVGPRLYPLGRPLITLAHDAYNHCERALYLSFGAADSECVLMVLRDYVRRWGCLPRIIVVDGGLNLRSKSVMRFFRIHNITVLRRAKHNPRQGTPIEVVFKAREVQVDLLLAGNTSHLKWNARAYNGHPSPKSRATETLYSLYMRYQDYYLGRKYELDVHPALGVTPKEFEAEMLRQRGSKPFKKVNFDVHLLIQTSPYPRQCSHKVYPKRGVWVGYRWFYHPAFAKAKNNDKAVIRIERFNADIVYVEFHKTLLVASTSDINSFPGRTSYQMEQAIAQFHLEANKRAQRENNEPSSRRDVLGVKAQHFDPTIGWQEEELRRLYSFLGMLPLVDALLRRVKCMSQDEAEALMEEVIAKAKQSTEEKPEMPLAEAPPDAADGDELADSDMDAADTEDDDECDSLSLNDVDLAKIPDFM